MRAGIVLLAGVACVCVGMAAAITGVATPSLFPAGTWLILIGLIACAAAGVMRVAESVSGENEVHDR